MNQLIVSSYDEFASYLGKKLGESDWLLVDQDRINLFADATLDHQWIHVDTDRAAKESPYGCTIAHGYLTLSLLPYMWAQVPRGAQYLHARQLWHGQDALRKAR